MLLKRFFIFLLVTTLLCGCSNIQKLPHDTCDFLIHANWEGNDTQCTNIISFGEDFSFSNWCACGSPVGDGDLCEKFCYDAKNHSIFLLDSEDNVIETGTIMYADDWYLIVDLWDRCYVYENLDLEHPTPYSDTLKYIGIEEMSKPCLMILGYNDDTLTVSAHNYAHDASSDFETWTLNASQDISFSTVTVTVENGVATTEASQLTQTDYKHIGENYTYGYVEMNHQGQVTNIIFYGETIIQN